MRVISGRFKGRTLASFKAPHIRPTTDRVKESLFNKVQGQIAGSRVLDLFSGTGSLGIEAISRDAGHVHFVEEHAVSLKILRKNLSLLGIEEGFTIEKLDVFKFLKKNPEPAFDVILIDPPFTRQWAHEILQALSLSANLWHEDTLIAIETVKGEKVEKRYGELSEMDEKNFGDKSLRWFKLDRETA